MIRHIYQKEQLMKIVSDIKGEMADTHPKKYQCPVCGKPFSHRILNKFIDK